MRWLDMHEWGLSPEITRLVVPEMRNVDPVLRFTLQGLNWWLNWTNLSFLTLFLSPHLTRIDINTNVLRFSPTETVDPWIDEIPTEVLPVMRSAIKMFPPSLTFLGLYMGNGRETRLTEEISAYILQCGKLLQEFHSNLVLSTGALVHLMDLPSLRQWTTEQEPPEVADLIHHGVPDGPASLLSSLQLLQLRGEPTLGWLSFFNSPKDQSPSWTLANNNLINLAHYRIAADMAVIDSALLSKFLPFTSLVNMFIGEGCQIEDSNCTSRFTDEDVESLAIAMPKLEVLTLGRRPCNANTCPTTVLSFLFLSIHCTKLKQLSIHFRTSNMPAEIMSMVDYASSHDLFQRPKCPLDTLVMGDQILHLEDHEIALVSVGIAVIFPFLTRFGESFNRASLLKNTIAALGMAQESLDLTGILMAQLVQLRSFEEHESPSTALVSHLHLAGWLGDGSRSRTYSNHSLLVHIGSRGPVIPRSFCSSPGGSW